MSQGQGSVSYDTPSSGSGGGGIVVNGARNGLSVDGGGYIVLGQTVGETGSPASLLDDREIPLAGNTLSLLLQAGSNLEFSPGEVAMYFNPTTTGQQFGQIYTIQGFDPGTNPYGNFQLFWLDQGFTNPDGQIDAVITWGYNTNGSDGRIVTNEAMFSTVLESHYQQDGVGPGQFEYYLTSMNFSGGINRHMFLVATKDTGAAFIDWSVESMNFIDTSATDSEQWGGWSSAGLVVTGTSFSGGGGVVSGATPTPAVDGAWKIEPTVGSNGVTAFINESGVSTGFFNFLTGGAQFYLSNFVDGFTNFWCRSLSPTARTRNFVVSNDAFSIGTYIFAVWNDGTISTNGNARFGDGGAGAMPTAQVNTSPGTAAADNGQLKLSVDVALKTVPEDGLFEYVGGLLYFTVGSTRKTVTLV